MASFRGTAHCLIDELAHDAVYFSDFRLTGFPRRTPGPPPFSSMNSTPAVSKARRTAKSFAAVIEVSRLAISARRIVRMLTADWRESSSAVHLISARAALIWELLRVF